MPRHRIFDLNTVRNYAKIETAVSKVRELLETTLGGDYSGLTYSIAAQVDDKLAVRFVPVVHLGFYSEVQPLPIAELRFVVAD